MKINWGPTLDHFDWDDDHPMGRRTEPVLPQKIEKIEIQLFTGEQLQLQSLIESGLVADKDLVFATSIANAPKATATQLKWVKTLLDKLICEPPVRYEFTNIFSALDAFFGKKYFGQFQGYPLTMKVATPAAKHPGAIYIVSEKPGLGYIGRIDLDHSIAIPKRCEEIKEDLIKYLQDLNSDPAKNMKQQASLSKPNPIYGAELVHKVQPETLQQQVARGPFDPTLMNAVLSEYEGQKGRRW